MIRAKQIDMDELYDVLDERYANIKPQDKEYKVTISSNEANWVTNGLYKSQEITTPDLADITSDTKLYVKVPFNPEMTEDEMTEQDNLFTLINAIHTINGGIEVTIKNVDKLTKDLVILLSSDA